MRSVLVVLTVAAACGGERDPSNEAVTVLGVERARAWCRWEYELVVRVPCTQLVQVSCSAPKSRGKPHYSLGPDDPRLGLDVEDGEIWIEIVQPASSEREPSYSNSIQRVPLVDVKSGSRHRVRVFWRHPLDSLTAPFRQLGPFYIDVP
jgi:hypothetical protein